MDKIRLVAGKPDDVAHAILAGAPISKELQRVHARVLREHLAELVAKHPLPPEAPADNVTPFRR